MTKAAERTRLPSVAIIQPSFSASRIEWRLGVERLKQWGFRVVMPKPALKREGYLAASDEARAQQIFAAAIDPSIDVLWCARGGFGAQRLLPYLDRWTAERGLPEPKLLIGYSDATGLIEFARTRWNWPSLHGPMPALREFLTLRPGEERALRLAIGTPARWLDRLKQEPLCRGLRWLGTVPPPKRARGTLIGGNLRALTSLIGTPYAPQARGGVLFLEEVGERLYTLDWMLTQLAQSGALAGLEAIVVGDVSGSIDRVSQGIAKPLPAGWLRWPRTRVVRELARLERAGLVPIRPTLAVGSTVTRLLGDWSARLNVPIVRGVPAGHDGRLLPLPIGAEVELSARGELWVRSWPWTGHATLG